MKLIIQIPAYNEEETLGITLRDLPREVSGIDEVEWLVIDDGSADRTAEVASACGVDHVVRLAGHQGLAAAFREGLDACLRRGADLIVNTDADNQYRGADIPRLVAPLIAGEADLVVGARPIARIAHFSPIKKALQFGGSWVVRAVSGTGVTDCTSGFRAYTRRCAERLTVRGSYTYTIETILLAGRMGLRTTSVPVGVNPDLRESRLVKNIPTYCLHAGFTLARFWLSRPKALESGE